MQKFIITEDGTMRFVDVRLHRDLIPDGDDTCHGGGFWRIDNQRACIILYGRSFDFGPPEFVFLERIHPAYQDRLATRCSMSESLPVRRSWNQSSLRKQQYNSIT